MSQKRALYQVDPNELPRYSLEEAARYVDMPKTTVHNWVSGRQYKNSSGTRNWANLIQRPVADDGRLSFSNLIEIYVLSALRKQFRVKMREVRAALQYTQDQLKIGRVLLSPHLRATEGNVFLEHLGSLINIGKGGQEAFPEIFQAYLARIEWNLQGFPRRVFPLTREDFHSAPRLVAIDPTVAFGRPVLERRGVKTATIAERFFQAGESIHEIAEDFDLEAFEVEEAIRYEGSHLAA
ncbi:MAG: DUF433 domain-containing protein [Thermoanaerobaculia bacterium]|nr:DUF433 domain-containing protein [Thermoanaerobaculia bacterium]